MATLIKNGTIVTSVGQYKADVLIEGETISAIGKDIQQQVENLVEAEGKYIFPGGIDAHTHFWEGEAFGISSSETGINVADTISAAVAGGTTTIIQFASQPKGMSLVDSVKKYREEKFENRSSADFYFHIMIMHPHEGIYDELSELVKYGVSTIKLLKGYKGTEFFHDDALLFRMLQKSRDVGVLTLLHAENGDVIDILRRQLIAENKTAPKYHAVSRPTLAEADSTASATMLAKIANAPIFIVHISCTEAMVALREARQKGIAAFGETCPQYLALDVENESKPNFEGAKYIVSPPLREAWHQDNLWEALQEGWLHTVGSDHCDFTFKHHKKLGLKEFTKIPSGAPSLQYRLAILYTYGVLRGKLSLERMVDVFATAPAKMFGLYPRKGGISIGSDADLIIFDPNYRGTISVKTGLDGSDYCIYEGFEQVGRAERVYLRGSLCVDGGQFIGSMSHGKFIESKPYGFAYNQI